MGVHFHFGTQCGWRPMKHTLRGVESWEHEDTGDHIDYYPKRDRAKTTLKSHPQDERGIARGNPHNKDLIREDIGGNAGLAKIFQIFYILYLESSA